MKVPSEVQAPRLMDGSMRVNTTSCSPARCLNRERYTAIWRFALHSYSGPSP